MPPRAISQMRSFLKLSVIPSLALNPKSEVEKWCPDKDGQIIVRGRRVV